MATLAWILAGIAVLVAILALGLRINRKKRTARLAVRLAEVYRAHGRFDVAEALYQVPARLDQNVDAAREGRRRAEAGDRAPVLDRGLVEDAERTLAEAREHLVGVFEDRGIDVELPPLDDGGSK